MNANFSTNTMIQAPLQTVWNTLADIGNIAQWNEGVQHSHLVGDQAEGVGASRTCDLGGGNYLDEDVVIWEPPYKLTMRITQTNLPFQQADIQFTLTPHDHGTQVTVAPAYKLKFGLLGQFLDYIYVHNSYQKGMANLLVGLKQHVEELSV